MTAIKEYLWIVAILGFMFTVLNAFIPGWGAKGVSRTFAVSRRRALRRLQQRREWLVQLKESDRAYYGWLLSAILWGLVIFAGAMMFHGLMHYRAAVNPQAKAVDDLFQALVQYGGGMLAAFVAGSGVRTYRSLQAFDQSMADLDCAIAKLEAKLPRSVQPAATGDD
jgi:hypothetical protein